MNETNETEGETAMAKNFETLEVGKTYRSRAGRLVRCIRIDEIGGGRPFCCKHVAANGVAAYLHHHSNGDWCAAVGMNEDDIVELVETECAVSEDIEEIHLYVLIELTLGHFLVNVDRDHGLLITHQSGAELEIQPCEVDDFIRLLMAAKNELCK